MANKRIIDFPTSTSFAGYILQDMPGGATSKISPASIAAWLLGAGGLSALTLGETSQTAYRGDRGKSAFDHSVAVGNAHNMAYSQLLSIPAALDAIDGLVPADNQMSYYTGAGTASLTTLSAFARTVLDDADGPAMLTTLGAIPLSQKGAANGVAPLGSDSKIAATYLPAYVDDVLEFANLAAFPATGESGKIYVALDTNKTYRWSGSAYVVISETLALGETSSTAYRGDRGKTAYDHSQTTGNPHGTTFAQITSTPTTLVGYGITDAQAALGYTPVNKAGDTMTGALTLSAGNLNISAGAIQTAGVTRISNGGAGVLTTLSTTGLATLNSLRVTAEAGTGSRLVQASADGTNSATIPVPSAFAQTLLDDADAATARTTLGVSSLVDFTVPAGDGATRYYRICKVVLQNIGYAAFRQAYTVRTRYGDFDLTLFARLLEEIPLPAWSYSMNGQIGGGIYPVYPVCVITPGATSVEFDFWMRSPPWDYTNSWTASNALLQGASVDLTDHTIVTTESVAGTTSALEYSVFGHDANTYSLRARNMSGTGNRLTQSSSDGTQSATIPVPSAFAQTLLDDADAAAARATLGAVASSNVDVRIHKLISNSMVTVGTTETTLDSFTVPAGTIVTYASALHVVVDLYTPYAGDVIRVKYAGYTVAEVTTVAIADSGLYRLDLYLYGVPGTANGMYVNWICAGGVSESESWNDPGPNHSVDQTLLVTIQSAGTSYVTLSSVTAYKI